MRRVVPALLSATLIFLSLTIVSAQNVTPPYSGGKTYKKLPKIALPNKTFYTTGKTDNDVRYGYIADAAHTRPLLRMEWLSDVRGENAGWTRAGLGGWGSWAAFGGDFCEDGNDAGRRQDHEHPS